MKRRITEAVVEVGLKLWRWERQLRGGGAQQSGGSQAVTVVGAVHQRTAQQAARGRRLKARPEEAKKNGARPALRQGQPMAARDEN